MASITIDPITIPEDGWTNLHLDSYLVSKGVEQGDQLQVTVLGGAVRYNFDSIAPGSEYGYGRASQGDVFLTRYGLDCWIDAIGGDAQVLVEYAP